MLCETCVYAEWEMTNHKKPKINKKKPGVCNYKVDKDELLKSLKIIIPACKLIDDRQLEPSIYTFLKWEVTLWTDYDINECSQYIRRLDD
jgi:hypothetical protein